MEDDHDNPEWTAADFVRARPASEIHSAKVVGTLMRQPTVSAFALAMQRQQGLAREVGLAA